MKVILRCVGPDIPRLAAELGRHGWTIYTAITINTQRGEIVGEHTDPDSFLGFGINDGTRVMIVIHGDMGVVDEGDTDTRG